MFYSLQIHIASPAEKALNRGKCSLASQGISFGLEQVQKGLSWFQHCISLNEIINVDESDDDATVETVTEQEEDDEEEYEEALQLIDENTLSVREEIILPLTCNPALSIMKMQGISYAFFPKDISQSTFEGRDGSSPCLFIDLLFTNTFIQLSMCIENPDRIPDEMHPLVFNSLRNGNAIYDRYNESFNGTIPDIDEACDFLLDEEVHVEIESVLEVYIHDDMPENQLHIQLQRLKEDLKYIGAVHITNYKSTVFIMDPHGGLLFMDSHRHEDKGLFLGWTREGNSEDMVSLVAPLINSDNRVANLAIVSFGT